MYQIGEKVLYGVHGVCCVVDREQRAIDRKKIVYLVLEPLGQPGSRYMVPVENKVAMSKLSPMLSREELDALLDGDALVPGGWIADENQRKQYYRELISSGNRIALMQMCHALYLHRDAQLAAGRKVHMCDENFLRDAEKLLCGEISLIMEVDFDEAKRYFKEHLHQ